MTAGREKPPRSVVVIEPAASAPALYVAADKSPHDIERDINETRAELGEILDALEQKLAPRRLVEQSFDALRETMSTNGGKIGETLRSHPVPLALIGVGLGWMLTAGVNRGGGSGHAFEQQGSKAMPYPTGGIGDMAGYAYARTKSGLSGEGMGQAAGKAGDMANKAASASADMMKGAAQRASKYAQQAGEQMSGMGERVSHLVEDNPLATAAVAFVAGAVIGLLLPVSRVEADWMGETGETLREQAGQMGRDAVDRARDVAERSVDAAVTAAKEATAAAGDAAEKTGEEAKKAVDESKG